MGYPRRPCFDGAVYHITARGNNRQALFFDDADYQDYLLRLRGYKDRFGFQLYAYALMPNHIHLILESGAGHPVSKVIQCLHATYVKYWNRRYQRVGHAFQGRFHSRLIDKDVYLLVASRYVHLNPVRAGLVAHPADYPWSSYHAYFGSAKRQQLVDTTLVLSMLSRDPTRQQTTYQDFVERMPTSEVKASEVKVSEVSL